MADNLDPKFGVKPPRRLCEMFYAQSQQAKDGVLLRPSLEVAVKMGTIYQEEFGKLITEGADLSDATKQKAAVETAKRYFATDGAVRANDMYKHWGAARDFLCNYWVHDSDPLHKVVFEEMLKHESVKVNKIQASGLQKVAYDVAEDWIRRIQLRLKIRPHLTLAVVAEKSFSEAFAASDSDNKQMVRTMALAFLGKQIAANELRNIFSEWSSTHQFAPTRIEFDPDCPHTEASWAERAAVARSGRTGGTNGGHVAPGAPLESPTDGSKGAAR